MTLRCLEPSGNGGEGTGSQWGTAGSAAEEPSPEAARLAKALRELSQTGREPTGRGTCGRGRLPKDARGRGGKPRVRWKYVSLLPIFAPGWGTAESTLAGS
uniref:Suppressor of cytokine signaling 2 n=1 Tax=Cebus imitator TaxID=2715852 RepID=A0A2K5QMF8_CEBIM